MPSKKTKLPKPAFKTAAVSLHCGDNLEVLRAMPTASVDLVFTSPPYEAARTYGIGFNLRGQDWVDWMVPRVKEMLRISKGLVAIVCEGQTRHYRYSASPVLLMADLHRAGIHVRKPPLFARKGIPGSGGPDWLRNDYEFIICCTNGGRLPWSDNSVMGKPPKGDLRARYITVPKPDGTRARQHYTPPAMVNPGNIVHCPVGGNHMGSKLASENEAPFPESLPEFFIRSFCPPGGIVLDPHIGSGTTAAVCQKFGRRCIGIDVRKSQLDICGRRLAPEKTARRRKAA